MGEDLRTVFLPEEYNKQRKQRNQALEDLLSIPFSNWKNLKKDPAIGEAIQGSLSSLFSGLADILCLSTLSGETLTLQNPKELFEYFYENCGDEKKLRFLLGQIGQIIIRREEEEEEKELDRVLEEQAAQAEAWQKNKKKQEEEAYSLEQLLAWLGGFKEGLNEWDEKEIGIAFARVFADPNWLKNLVDLGSKWRSSAFYSTLSTFCVKPKSSHAASEAHKKFLSCIEDGIDYLIMHSKNPLADIYKFIRDSLIAASPEVFAKVDNYFQKTQLNRMQQNEANGNKLNSCK